MRLSTGQKPRTRYLVYGALLGAALFTVGRHLMTPYLANAAAVSAYGAAGSLIVLLMWIYFSSAVLLRAPATPAPSRTGRRKSARKRSAHRRPARPPVRGPAKSPIRPSRRAAPRARNSQLATRNSNSHSRSRSAPAARRP